MTLRDLVGEGRSTACAGRSELTLEGWGTMVEALPHAAARLCGLWADGAQVHALFYDGTGPFMASVGVADGRYHALSPWCPGAGAYERIIHDLWGIEAMGASGTAPWLDQGRWGVTWPLRDRAPPAPPAPDGVEFADGPVMERAGGTMLGYGPAEGGFHAPLHLRLGLPGQGILQVHPRMGYAHRGLCARMRGNTLAEGGHLVARIDAGATVAHQLAFARAVAAAGETDSPGGGAIVPAELERVATHLDVLAQMADMLGDGRLASQAATLLEDVRQLCHAVYGHRLLFDVLPLRSTAVLAPQVLEELQMDCMALRRLFWRPRGLAAQLMGRGVLPAATARQWGIAGCAGRASGGEADLRRHDPLYAPGWLAHSPRTDGDMTARLATRLHELGESMQILRTVAAVPALPAQPPAEGMCGEGLGLAEGPAGPVWHWLRVHDGRIAAWWCGDPSLAHIQALPAILSGAVYEDVAPILTSLGLSAAGADL
ncbi:NADH-quinone oxidoreductase subunit D-related protein [Komagataeibacter medellinensis]|uniref:NADH-ubiquinone oxidoreductase 49kDa subunit n=1 Tax=Komagataeibacter medellinensis (strain NBRC 3288 / BCRC 11682 / LMG 1693 / Kondo 51) TaxID=634177 RepID=G2I5J0_KOMMN|nr:NADH-quinone oxidoreductase [Komagataeibacter medellinensis]BAK83387.1 NADH-ubiquinone oxidoreductase 49kDa subunit [Komagataeibacter medellinensis NBRC 3288]